MPPQNLPAHLQNQHVPNLTERALEGLGASLPPHISMQGNSFTLIDGAGNEQPMGVQMEACIVDMADVMCKRYQKTKWTPGANDPPTCFSMNGIAPSRDASEPQARTCAECDLNVRGSAISEISGASIKACRDEKPMALLFPQFPNMLFRLTLTPGSFKNWSAYMRQFEQHQVNLADVLTAFSFEPKKTMVLDFKPGQDVWIDAPTAEARGKALAAKATDALVGRLDKPIQAALVAPTGQAVPNQVAAQPQTSGFAQPAGPAAAPQPFGQSPSPLGTQLHQDTPTQALNGGVTPASPSEPARRPRRTKAQIEADNAAQAGGALGQPQQAQPVATPATRGFQPAPFRPNPAPEQGASPFGQGSGGPAAGGFAGQPAATAGGGFGIQSGVAPNPELSAALDNVFGKQ